MLIHGFIHRATHSEFVIPYEKYITSIKNPIGIGTRFRMRFEMDDSPERRYYYYYYLDSFFVLLLVFLEDNSFVLQMRWCSDWSL